MITIDQLLESVDLDFEPRFVTKNKNGYIYIWGEKPHRIKDYWTCDGQTSECVGYNNLKLAEFDGNNWSGCIYEVPRKTTGKLKHIERVDDSFVDKINAIIDAVSEINENYACIAALTDIRKRLDTLEKCVKNKRGE